MAQPCPLKAASFTLPCVVHTQVDADVVAAQRVLILKADVMRVQLAPVLGRFITFDNNFAVKIVH